MLITLHILNQFKPVNGGKSMSRKTTALLAVMVMLLGIGAGVLSAMQHQGSWTGEVIDVSCHVSKGAKGASHADCGAKCVKAGLPVGLLVGDTTYLLISADHKAMNDTLAEHVGHTVTVTGTSFESKGANLIEVKDFKMAK
jgi:hypothetical protein